VPRFRPSRWIAVLAIVVLSPIVSALVFTRANPGAGAIVGLFVGLFCGFLVLAYYRGGDSRYFGVTRLRPNAIVLQGRRDPSSGWGPLDPLVLRSAVLEPDGAFTLSFEHGAMTLWGGASTPEELLVVPYDQIAEIGVGEDYREAGLLSRRNPYSRLRLTLLLDGTPHEVQFGVEEGFEMAHATRLAFLAGQLLDVLEGIVVIEPGEGAGRRLIPGMTAWSARQFATVAVIVTVVLSVFLVPIAVVLGGDLAVFLYAICGILVLGAVVMVVTAARIVRREVARGYTTLDGAHLGVEQRHPGTGAVIRAAGRPALTPEELRAALARRVAE
jgi:hypothetical protein